MALVNGLPPSFYKDGYQPLMATSFHDYRRLLIGTDGDAGTGKSEFILSCPGPGQILCLDRQIDNVIRNPHPPATRQSNFGVKTIEIPKQTAPQKRHQEVWAKVYAEYVKAISNPDARTFGMDGDGDSWDLQRLADLGKLTGVWPITKYSPSYSDRRLMYLEAWNSRKICIFTNKIRKLFLPLLDRNNNPMRDKNGEVKKEWDGQTYERVGYADQYYLFHMQLRHMYDKTKRQFGIRIEMCKHDRSLEGDELWGEDCNFRSLIQHVYPEVPLSTWGIR